MHLAYCGGGRQTFGGLKDGSIQSGHCPNRAALFQAKGQAPSLEYVGGGRGWLAASGLKQFGHLGQEGKQPYSQLLSMI